MWLRNIFNNKSIIEVIEPRKAILFDFTLGLSEFSLV